MKGRARKSMETLPTGPLPALAVDCVVFGVDDASLQVMLIRRGLEPFAGWWALPGGFVHIDETVEAAARRELAEEAGLSEVYLEQLYTFSAVDRDPRARVVSVAHYALVKMSDHRAHAATDATDAAWFPVSELPQLPFDHHAIVQAARERLRNKLSYAPVGFELLPKRFSLFQLQRLYEIILERPLDKRNFRKKALATGLLLETSEVESNVAHRAARLYRFDERKYQRLAKTGMYFEL